MQLGKGGLTKACNYFIKCACMQQQLVRSIWCKLFLYKVALKLHDARVCISLQWNLPNGCFLCFLSPVLATSALVNRTINARVLIQTIA